MESALNQSLAQMKEFAASIHDPADLEYSGRIEKSPILSKIPLSEHRETINKYLATLKNSRVTDLAELIKSVFSLFGCIVIQYSSLLTIQVQR